MTAHARPPAAGPLFGDVEPPARRPEDGERPLRYWSDAVVQRFLMNAAAELEHRGYTVSVGVGAPPRGPR